MQSAALEEVTLTNSSDIIISGDGTWKTRGYSSRVGVCAVIGDKTGKCIDVEVMSSFCKAVFLKLSILKNSLVNVALYHIHHIWHYRVRLRESGQPIGRLRKTCKNAFPRTIPVSFGRLDIPIATESSS
ncbi:hypothetical protein TNCV_445481 [Trichonephila clavipes]|nr:hypothetical protein TNCV_445481 [Trichonephila clavipes]